MYHITILTRTKADTSIMIHRGCLFYFFTVLLLLFLAQQHVGWEIQTFKLSDRDTCLNS